jgi:hypothetical protein
MIARGDLRPEFSERRGFFGRLSPQAQRFDRRGRRLIERGRAGARRQPLGAARQVAPQFARTEGRPQSRVVAGGDEIDPLQQAGEACRVHRLLAAAGEARGLQHALAEAEAEGRAGGVLILRRGQSHFGGFDSAETRMGYKVAVVGATGNVGREMLNILAERKFPATRSSRSPRAARSAPGGLLRRQALKVQRPRELRLLRRRLRLMSAGSASPRSGRRRSARRAASSSITRASGATTPTCR